MFQVMAEVEHKDFRYPTKIYAIAKFATAGEAQAKADECQGIVAGGRWQRVWVEQYDATMTEDGLYITTDDSGVHYPIAEDGSLDAPCACNECRAGQRGKLDQDWGQGHFLCCGCPDELLWAEEYNLIGAVFTDSRWTWFVSTDLMEVYG